MYFPKLLGSLRKPEFGCVSCLYHLVPTRRPELDLGPLLPQVSSESAEVLRVSCKQAKETFLDMC